MLIRHASPLDDLEISDARIEEVIEPFVSRMFDPDDAEWRKLYNRTSIIRALQKYRRQVRRLFGMETRRTKRQAEGYGERYTAKWREDTLRQGLALNPGQTPCAWKGRGYRLNAIGIKRVHQLYFMNILEALQPESVLEVGYGVGLNIFTMAARFPDIRFAGVELSSDAVMTGNALIQRPQLPEPIQTFSPEPAQSLTAHARVVIEQGNAAMLALPDASQDLVFSVQALEQMESIRERALSEMARVSRKYVVMFEAFRDWNATGLHRDCIVGKNYFQAWVSDLGSFGLVPIYIQGDLPSKIDMNVGLVVARVSDSA